MVLVLSYFSGIFLRKSYTNRVIRTLFFGRVRTGSRIPEVVESHEIRREKYNIGCKTQVMWSYSTCGSTSVLRMKHYGLNGLQYGCDMVRANSQGCKI
jgi:hypothetical protein